MIEILKKEDCVGCNACVQRCPKQCISMHEDEQGFLYPKVDLSLCIHCDLCEKVCPVINQAEPRKPTETYAAKNPDYDVRMSSSSGGIFYALAMKIIEDGGVVFGAKFNEQWEVVHDYAETLEGIKAFQGSKYVQSRIGDTFLQAEEFLKAGRKVMFTGTPCQIAALGLFLRKDYGKQLLKVDVVCHGVPSPLVWREYLKYITRPKGASAGKNTVFSSLKETPVITGISFRDKRLGWEKFGFSVRVAASQASGKNSVLSAISQENPTEFFEPFSDNLYMRIFLKDLDLRPSCYQCPAKTGKSMSDYTIGDFWGVDFLLPTIFEDSGVSLLLDYSSKIKIADELDMVASASNYGVALRSNPAIEQSVKRPKVYNLFWQQFHSENISTAELILKKMNMPIYRRILRRVGNMLPLYIKSTIKHYLE